MALRPAKGGNVTTVNAAAGRLPSAFASFIGRRCEIDGIICLLGTARLVTLTGVGGVGKTRLALEAARVSRKNFADGVWLVDLATVADPARVASATAAALGAPDLGTGPVLEQLAGHLAGRRALLVLDNCEHVVDACAQLARTLLSAAAELRILATSRHSLGIEGEHLFTVSPLPEDDAVELLRDRAVAVRSDFRLTDENRAVISRLCTDLDGLPLAIELAASRLRTLTAEQVADRLEDRFALLTGGSRTARPQQRTLRSLVDWSYELCAPAERRLWNRLSVFAGAFSLDAAEQICSGDGVDRSEVLDLLDRLVSQSVVVTVCCEATPRYRLLETIRAYGRARLAESGEQRRLWRRHRDFFLALAQSTADRWCGPDQEADLNRLRAEHADLTTALDCREDPQVTLALATALRYHWCVGGFLGEGRRRLEQALANAPEPTPNRARALWAAAWIALIQGHHAVAERWLDEADQLAEKLNDPVTRAYVEGFRGTSAVLQGRLDEALALHEAAAAAHLALGETTGAIFALFQLAHIRRLFGDPRAAETGRQALALAEERGEQWGRAQALLALAHDAWARGDGEACAALIRAALKSQQGFNDYIDTAIMLELLAWTTAAAGDVEWAARLLGAVGSLLRKIGTSLTAFGPQVAEDHARCQAVVIDGLGPTAYEAALAEGAEIDTAARAAAYALGSGDTGPERTARVAAACPLTRRERDVAAMVAKGLSNRQIAADLVLSPRTVDRHVENILAKFGFDRRAQIAAWWATNELPTP